MFDGERRIPLKETKFQHAEDDDLPMIESSDMVSSTEIFHRELSPPLREGLVPKRENWIPDIKEGQELTDQRGEKYLVKKKLGQGGMGVVFQVVEERTELDRALKVILPDRFNALSTQQRDGALKRFRREMDILSKLHNPFILPAVDIIEFPLGKETVLGFVTDMVEGSNLDDEIQKGKDLVPDRAVEYAGEIAMALMSLDGAGLVHRDLKPANIFLEAMPNGKKFVRVGDFGLAMFEEIAPLKEISDTFKSVQLEHSEPITNFGMIVGSPGYMSPEQLRGEPATHLSDLYALGTILYEMISGQKLFIGKNFQQIAEQHLEVLPTSFDHFVDNVPPWLEGIVMKLLAKNPYERFDSAKSVFVALKDGVKKDYPDLLKEEPFMWNVASDVNATRFAVAS